MRNVRNPRLQMAPSILLRIALRGRTPILDVMMRSRLPSIPADERKRVKASQAVRNVTAPPEDCSVGL